MSFKPRVLIVDDELLLRRLLERILRAPTESQSVADAETGLLLLEQQPFDVVVSDCSMAGMDGVTFLSEVARRWPATRRILLSGSLPEDADDLVARGICHAYGAKPLGAKAVLSLVMGAESFGTAA
ncbi:MAG: response regulator [Deltaproteobacteria bacterium]|nr:response regulator [Deltaproteobacteria bacterium]